MRSAASEPSSSFLLVPHGYEGTNRVQVWVGTHQNAVPERLWLRCEPTLNSNAESNLNSETSCRDIPLQLERKAEGLSYTLLTIPTVPGCHYQLSLWQWVDNTPSRLAEADCRGRPDSLSAGFNVWYGTCFYRQVDHGALGEAFAALPPDCRPDVSFLGGDQVYLDTAFSNTGFTFTPGFSTRNFSPLVLRTKNGIRRILNPIFAKEYRESWWQGLRNLLRSGNHYFLAGDHEFWNDYPNPPGFIPALWFGKVRNIWNSCARQLYNAYQLPDGKVCNQFEIGDDLSFFVLDTRLQRDRGSDSQVTDPENFSRLQTWFQELRSPGVLVLPAPLLTHWQFNASSLGKSLLVKLGLGDHSLADTGQYQDLVRALNACTQDVLVLAGDVHYSRLAQFELNGKKVVEVVSSPLSCLPSATAVADQKLASFPDRPTDGIDAKIQYLQTGSASSGKPGSTNNNFATLRFTRVEAGVNAEVSCWNINARDEQGRPRVDWEDRNVLLRKYSQSTELPVVEPSITEPHY